MSDMLDKLNRLETRLAKMVEYQDYFYRETNQIREEIAALKHSFSPPPIATDSEIASLAAENVFSKPPLSDVIQPKNFEKKEYKENRETKKTQPAPTFHQRESHAAIASKSSIEEFIGRNLISLVGIIILVLGVGIGAKYAIDRDLISPLTRIVLGYVFAAGLLAVAVWLKKKYLNFSAVLLSGALAIMYFLTFFAYSFYDLIPQQLAFLMMLVITAFSVVAAINYNRQVIAHIGLVGAYAVPFLLSENSGRADILFGYMAIINFGVLAISVKKFWKPLYYSSFIFTWLIYAVWYLLSYRAGEHFLIALGFAFIFFLTFYLTFLSYKLLAKEEFNSEIVILVLVNSFVFYGFGYATLESRDGYEPYLGLFTLGNASLNFFVAFVIHRYQLGDRKNFYLAIALALTFLTIAVPVEFNGNWVTLIWTAEAALLFWVGRTKQIALYENLSYPLMLLASISLLNDWQNAHNYEIVLTPIFNQNFMSAILFAAAFGFIAFVNRDDKYKSSVEDAAKIIDFIIPTIFLFALYNAFRTEIGVYFFSQTADAKTISGTEATDAFYRSGSNMQSFNVIWQINYTMLFLTILSVINIRKIKSGWLGFINLGLNAVVLFAFLSIGLYLFSDLRTIYLTQLEDGIFPGASFNIFIRYFAYAFVAGLIYASYEYVKQEFLSTIISKESLVWAFDLCFHIAFLWIASSELINLTDIFGYRDSNKLGLSILWGLYALALIVLGIVKRKAHLRIGAIVLFSVTLVKLFFYDIADLDTISKTIVFVSLGILLLIISFLYNKYKDLIFDRNES